MTFEAGSAFLQSSWNHHVRLFFQRQHVAFQFSYHSSFAEFQLFGTFNIAIFPLFFQRNSRAEAVIKKYLSIVIYKYCRIKW